MTGLALLSYLAHCETPLSEDFGEMCIRDRFHIRFRQPAENIRMGAFTVVTVEKNHCLPEKRGDCSPCLLYTSIP